MLKTLSLYFTTATAEIIGCYFSYLWLNKGWGAWILIPSIVSLALFVWLLTLHPTATGRVYAAYGGVYIISALMWLHLVDGAKLTVFDFTGAFIVLVGISVIIYGWRGV